VFADPQSVTYATVAKSLPRIGTTDSSSEYRLVDSGGVTYDLQLSHQFAKRQRVVARLRRDSVVTDPLVPANSIAASMTATLTIDFPNTGLYPTDAQDLANALVAWLTSGNILKLANGET
jgi:hypothetical protein